MDPRKRLSQFTDEEKDQSPDWKQYLIEKNPELQELAAKKQPAAPEPAADPNMGEGLTLEAAAKLEAETPKSLADRYKALVAGDDEKLAAARKDADRQKMIASVFQGIGTAFGGKAGRQTDGFYDGLRKQADSGVEALESDRKRKTEDLLTGHKLLQVEGGDQASKSLDLFLATKKLAKPEELAGMSFDQKKDLFDSAINGKKGGGGFQQATIMKDGKVHAAVFDPSVGEYKVTDDVRGYALGTGTDPVSGNLLAINKADSTSAPRVIAGAGRAAEATEADPRALYTSLTPKQREGYDKTNTALNKDPVVVQRRKALAEGQDIKNLLTMAKRGEKVDPGVLQTRMARFAGEVGNLAEHDKKGFGGEGGWNAMMDRMAQGTLFTGEMRPEDIALMEKIVDSGYAASTANIKGIEKRYADDLAMKTGLSPEQAATILSNPSRDISATAPKKKIVKKQHNKAAGKTRLTYEDGTTEIVDGLQ